MFREHSWEAARPHGTQNWEELGCDTGHDADSEDADPVEQATQEFADFLVDIYLSGGLSAKQFCILCHYAAAGGMRRPVHDYAKAPGAPTGHYQRFLSNKMFARNPDKLYWVDTVGSRKHMGAARVGFSIPVVPLHEALANDLASDRTVALRLREKVDSGGLPPNYFSHPLVASASEAILPVALYMDGLSYTASDSVIGIWLINMATTTRMLVGVIRKRLLCQCGCRGWDTLFPIFVYFRRCLEYLAIGAYPNSRPDSAPWRESDRVRASLGGQPLPMRACLVHIKGDWMELCSRLG